MVSTLSQRIADMRWKHSLFSKLARYLLRVRAFYDYIARYLTYAHHAYPLCASCMNKVRTRSIIRVSFSCYLIPTSNKESAKQMIVWCVDCDSIGYVADTFSLQSKYDYYLLANYFLGK